MTTSEQSGPGTTSHDRVPLRQGSYQDPEDKQSPKLPSHATRRDYRQQGVRTRCGRPEGQNYTAGSPDSGLTHVSRHDLHIGALWGDYFVCGPHVRE